MKKPRNYVAKYSKEFNRNSVHRDRTKYHRPSEDVKYKKEPNGSFFVAFPVDEV